MGGSARRREGWARAVLAPNCLSTQLERGQPLGHLSNRKKRCRPISSKPVFAAALQTSSAGRHEPAFSSFESEHWPSVWRGEAIRSVSHLGLARYERMSWLNPISNRKERTGPLLPGSLRLGFLGQPFYYHTRWFWQARASTSSAPIPPPAGPENFQCRAAFIQFQRAMVPRERFCLRGPTRC